MVKDACFIQECPLLSLMLETGIVLSKHFDSFFSVDIVNLGQCIQLLYTLYLDDMALWGLPSLVIEDNGDFKELSTVPLSIGYRGLTSSWAVVTAIELELDFLVSCSLNHSTSWRYQQHHFLEHIVARMNF